MIMSLAAIAIVALVTYIWLIRGFFSAFIHLIATIFAGAVAFAAWEPAAHFLLAKGGSGILGSSAWAIALAVPFAASLVLFRAIMDGILRANVVVGRVADYVGGGVCGLGAGIITSGIVVLSLGFMRLDTELWGYKPIEYSPNGSVVRGDKLWVPTDRIVAGLYGHLSQNAFRAPNALAEYYPNLAEVGGSMRLNYGDGKARNTLAPEDFKVLGRFTVGRQAGQLAPLMNDRWNFAAQQASALDGGNFPAASYIEGFVVEFNAGAKEKEGKIVIGAGQIWLVSESETDDESYVSYPVAVSTQAESSTPQLARFRFNSRDVYIANAGGGSTGIFGFEFVVPKGFRPKALYVKNVRHEVDPEAKPAMELPNAAARDGFIAGGGVTNIGGAGKAMELVENPDMQEAGAGRRLRQGEIPQIDGLVIRKNLPITIQKGTEGAIQVDDSNVIQEGTQAWPPDRVGIMVREKALRINELATTADTVIVQLQVHLNKPASLLGRAAAGAEFVVPPLLRDTNGTVYEPIGYLYKDTNKVELRFTPGNPVRALSELPSLSRSRPDQELTLIFRVSRGVDVEYFTLGSKPVLKFDPPIPMF